MAVINWLARSPGRAFVLIFLLALAVRGYFLTKVPREYVLPHSRWEMEAVATSLVQSGGFADPYILPTGPTAHLPPIMPGLLALIWGLFDMGLAAGYAAWLFRIATHSAIYAMLPWLAGRFGVGKQAGVLAGVAGALVPRWPGHGEALAAIVLGLLLVAFLRRWSGGRGRISSGGSFLLGLAWGVAFHLQPSLLPVLLGCVAFELCWHRDRRKWAQSAVMALGVNPRLSPVGLAKLRDLSRARLHPQQPGAGIAHGPSRGCGGRDGGDGCAGGIPPSAHARAGGAEAQAAGRDRVHASGES